MMLRLLISLVIATLQLSFASFGVVSIAPTYAGCPVFPAGDVYNRDVSAAALDPNSATIIASAASADKVGFYLSTGSEWVNLANSSTPVWHITGAHQSSWDKQDALLTGTTTAAWFPFAVGFKMEVPGGDQHALVLNTQTCRLYESYGTNPDPFTAGPLTGYSGWDWDLTKPFVRPEDAMGGSQVSAMASGLSLFAGAIKGEEIHAGIINHALNFAPPQGSFCAWCYVYPASSTGGDPGGYLGTITSYELPYGAHLRLHASYSQPCMSAGTCPQFAAIVAALKKYGMYMADDSSTCCQALYGVEAQSGNYWNGSDLANLSALHISDFDVLQLPAVECYPGHAGCTP